MEITDKLFKDKELINGLVKKLQNYKGRPLKIMEVCGTHTMAISRFGIRSLLPENIKLISGPGCPVCVTPNYYMKAAIELSNREDVIITSFGDLMRIPYGKESLLTQRAKGKDIRVVYSPLDSIKIAADNPDKKVVFLSVGFETTIPVIALSILNSVDSGVTNFMILSANKTIPEAMRILSSDEEIGVDGYLYPGNVSTIIGDSFYWELAEKYGKPGIISGFEPADILGSINKLVANINQNNIIVENLYSRAVKKEGNLIALSKMNEVFEECEAAWRGIGWIPGSGMKLREKYKDFDAWQLLEGIEIDMNDEPKGCRCGDILKGKCFPSDCKLFGKACTPESPVGSCMVSGEGTCAAYYKYC